MKIVELTGVLKSQEITITKSIGSIIISSDVALEDLLNEKITVFIERANGNNLILANKVNFRDFILASTYGSESVQSDDDNALIAICEIAHGGSIELAEKESIKIQLDDLRAPYRYTLHGVEEPVQTNELYVFENKTIASEDYNKKIDVKGFDLAIMTKDASVSDISYQFSNGQIVKYLPFELQTLSRDIDPICAIKSDNTILQGVTNRLALPLLHVDYIEVNKAQGSVINFIVRTVKNVG